MLQIHKRIKAERIKANLSEDEIAAKIGIGRTTYQYWEKKTPAVDKIKMVAKALGLPDDYFFVNNDENLTRASPTGLVNEDPAEYITAQDYGDPAFLAGQLSVKDEVLAEKEARRKEAVALAEKMEAHYKDMVAALERAQNTMKEVLQPMVTSLKEIPPVLDAILRNSSEHDREIMTALDHLVGNAPGTLQKEAGKRILKSAVEQQRKGKAEAGK